MATVCIASGNSSCRTTPPSPRSSTIVGLYVLMAAQTGMLSFDENSQIQTLDCTQPRLPMKKGSAGTMTHYYKRHGAKTLFTALNVLDGTVIARTWRAIGIMSSSASSSGSNARFEEQDHSRHSRQLCGTQEEQGAGIARAPFALDLPLHTNPMLMAQCRQCRQWLLRKTDPAAAQEWRLPFARRSLGRDQSFHLRIQR